MAHGHKYDTFWLQALTGQGWLYCQIIVRSEDLLQLDDADEPDIVLLKELEEDPVPSSIPKIRWSIYPLNALISSDTEQVINDLLDQQSIPDYSTMSEEQIMTDLD